MKQSKGVYYIQMDMMRGYNLKLTTDARVIICDTVGTLNLTQVEQMAGRASRSQNIQRCGVHLVEQTPGSRSTQPIHSILESREPMISTTCKPQMVRCVVRCAFSQVATMQQRKKIWTFFRYKFAAKSIGQLKMDLTKYFKNVKDKEPERIIKAQL